MRIVPQLVLGFLATSTFCIPVHAITTYCWSLEWWVANADLVAEASVVAVVRSDTTQTSHESYQVHCKPTRVLKGSTTGDALSFTADVGGVLQTDDRIILFTGVRSGMAPHAYWICTNRLEASASNLVYNNRLRKLESVDEIVSTIRREMTATDAPKGRSVCRLARTKADLLFVFRPASDAFFAEILRELRLVTHEK